MFLKKLKKYSIITLGSLIALWLITIALVYFLVDVNKLKDLAVTKVNETTNAELSIGEVKLKIFPLVYFELNNVIIKSSKAFDRKELFTSEKAKLSFNPILLIFGKTIVKLSIINPIVNIISDGVLNNLQDIISPSEEKTETASNPLNFIFFTDALFEIIDANLTYTAPNNLVNIDKLNLTLKIEPISKKINLSIKTPVAYKKEPMSIYGDLFFNLLLQIPNSNNAEIKMLLDANNLEIKNSSFKKDKGKNLKIEIGADTNLKDTINIKTFDIFLIEKLLSLSGTVKNFTDPIIDLKANINSYEIKNFISLLEALKTMNPEGVINSEITIKGNLPSKEKTDKKNSLNIDLKLDLSKLGFKNDMIKLSDTEIKTLMNLNYNENPVFNFNFAFNDKKEANNLNFNAANSLKKDELIVVDIKSSKLNIDSYMKQKPALKDETKKEEKASSKEKEPLDFPVLTKEQVLGFKKALEKYSIKLNSNLETIIFNTISIKNFIAEGLFNKDAISINKLNFKLFDGTFSSSFKTILNLEKPSFEGIFNLSKLEVKTLAKTMMPTSTGVLDGVISTKLNFKTFGYMMSNIKKNLIANGDFYFNNFRYDGSDLNKLISETVSDKVSGISKNLLGSKPGWETIQGEYKIKDEKINLIKTLAKENDYEANAKGWIGFNEYFDIFVDFKMPYKNIPYEALKIKNTEQSMLSVHLSGPILKPKFDTKYLLEFLFKKTKDYELQKIKGTVNKQIENVKKESKTKVKEEAKKTGKNLLKKFGF